MPLSLEKSEHEPIIMGNCNKVFSTLKYDYMNMTVTLYVIQVL